MCKILLCYGMHAIVLYRATYMSATKYTKADVHRDRHEHSSNKGSPNSEIYG